MPVSAVHVCLEYLIKSTDVALCLQWGGGEKRLSDKKEEQGGTNKKAMDEVIKRTKKRAKESEITHK